MFIKKIILDMVKMGNDNYRKSMAKTIHAYPLNKQEGEGGVKLSIQLCQQQNFSSFTQNIH